MVFLYNLGVRIYQLLVAVASTFNGKAKLFRNGRKGCELRLSESVKKDDRIVWFHCASLGEFEQGRPVIEAFRAKYPNIKILLTFFSPSGYEIRKNYAGADFIFYLPLDTYWNSKKFIDIVNPIATIFVKYEFWYHYLNQLKKRNIPIYIISAIFRADQVFFKSYGGWYRKFLFNFQHLFVQNMNSKELLAGIGVNNVTVAGDTRFDRVAANAQAAKVIPLIERFAANSRVLVAGSTWPKDEDLIVEYFKANPHNLKLIIAPHEIHDQNIEKLRERFGLKSLRYTMPNECEPSEAQILIIDTIGILSSVYRYGTAAYIGGGFGVGIHNTLEAAVFGIPVIFGPNYQRFQEAVELIEIGAAQSVGDHDQFANALNQLIQTESELQRIKGISVNYFSARVGATNTILDNIHLPNL
ncbi:MAG: 3-deoxy-D-manno-octulosonic acid transferase [Bacteroidales bacterium]|nr:MAG: 3-deoxy-D-manno-octulosonic acid transferase [Bacteroidales bacterium]